MLPLTDPATALFAVDAARSAVQDAEERLTVVTAQTTALEGRIDWVSPAAEAFRRALTAWMTDLAESAQLVAELDRRLVAARAMLLTGGDGSR